MTTGGKVKDLILRDVTLISNGVSGGISNGILSSVGVIAGTVQNGELDNISVQGNIHVVTQVSEVFVGGIVGHAINSIISNCETIGYIFVNATYESYISNFAVGSLVGYLEISDDENVTSSISGKSFVDISIMTTYNYQTISSLGGIGILDDDIAISAVNVSYLRNAFSLNGYVVSIAGGKVYSDYVLEDSSLIDTLLNYVVKPYYVPSTERTAGTTNNPYLISNHLQITLIKIYSFANYKLLNDIIIPPHTFKQTYIETYYGESYNEDGYVIYSSDIDEQTTLFRDAESQSAIVVKKRILRG
ncbi:MAG: hypothetical protein LBU04_03130 [Christensenellaceae bacterium]|nr:hypothetical protein [Christensenellaceae bacterium]